MLKTINFILVLILSSLSFAQTNTWTGSTDTDWHKACNWSLNTIPTASHDVVIPTVTNYPVVTGNAHCRTLSIPTPTTNALTINSSSTGDLCISSTNGGTCSTTITDNGGCVPPLAATVTYAPTVANPGLPNPTVGTFTQLLNVSPPASTSGLAKQVFVAVHNISGGDGGPYTVDFSGINYSVLAESCFGPIPTARPDLGWDKNVTAALSYNLTSQPVTGIFPVTAVVTGVGSGASDHAACYATIRLTSVPSNETLFTHTYSGPNTVTITDGSSNSLTLSLPNGSEGNTSGTGTYVDTWPYTATVCP